MSYPFRQNIPHQQQCASGGTFNSPYHLVASAAGEVCSADVQVNEEFVDREEFATLQLNEGDEVDFLYFMGGGAYV